MAKGEYTVSDIYQGGYSSLKPKYGDIFTNYRVNPSTLGLTTDPRTANIVQDVSAKLSSGVKQMEITAVSPEIFDSMPDKELREVNKLSKLTGVDISLHAPVIDSAGMSQQGFSEIGREQAERKISQILERSHELNPNGNIPVTFHAAEGVPGSEWTPSKEGGIITKRLIAVDRESGKMIPLTEEKKYYPVRHGPEGEILPMAEKGELISPEENLDMVNKTKWDNELSQLFFNKERADEILQHNQTQIQHLLEDINKGRINPKALTPNQEQAWIKYEDAKRYLQEIHKNANAIFSRAYEFGDERQREHLMQLSEQYRKDMGEGKSDIMGQSRAMHKLLLELQNPSLAPTMFVPVENFLVDKSSQTFGNAAFNAYKKLGDKTPILSIENPPAGFGISRGEELKKLVEASRKQFAERAVKEKGLSVSEAEKLAQKFIGVTWDVGHINMLRKYGYEAKDIIKESEKVAKLVKHIHLSDNFGFEHTELPMGMGNVPVKEILEKLGKEGFDAKKIIEAGQWWQHWRTPPFKETMEALGSQMYVFGPPSWDQSLGGQQNYYSGYGMMLPQINYETLGAGFSRLPPELGGQRPGTEGSRMSGRGME
jgi:sugar phosphate isomerase/epimerase